MTRKIRLKSYQRRISKGQQLTLLVAIVMIACLCLETGLTVANGDRFQAIQFFLSIMPKIAAISICCYVFRAGVYKLTRIEALMERF